MVQCEKCQKSFPQNYLLLRHMKRKFPCVKNDDLINNYDTQINDINSKIIELTELSIGSKTLCNFCNQIFSKKGNLERHLTNTCINKKNMESDKNKLLDKKNKLENNNNIDKLHQEIKKQKEDINNLKLEMDKIKNNKKESNVTIQQIINNNVNNVNNINNNVMLNINSFGKEDLSHISLDDYKKFLSGFFPGFIKFIEKIHFDDKAPENQNICISNLKSKYIDVYENNKWITKEKKDILDKFIRKKYNILDDKCDELEENNIIDDKIIEKFRDFQENYKNDESQKNTQNNIMLMIYNNRNKFEKIKKNNIKKIINTEPNLINQEIIQNYK
jgi:hypothetical protein